MAMINCPECGREISDKATKCIYCGRIINEASVVEKKCTECGAVITDEMDACPNFGCPIEKPQPEQPQKVEVTNVKLAVDKKKIKIIISVVAFIMIAVIAIVGFKIISLNNEKKAYADNYKKIVNLMLSGASNAESACGLIHDVWANTIYEEDDSKTDEYTKDSNGEFYDDFNTSLMMLMVSDNFTADIDDIKENQEQVQKLMKDMKNPPDEYKEAYDSLKNFYDAYTKLVGLATDPSGNLSSYTSNFNDADSETLNTYKAALLYLED